MIKILFTFIFIVAAMFILMALIGAGILMSLFARLTGSRKNSEADIAMLNSMASLTPGEQTVLREALAKDNPVIGNLSDQDSIDALIAKTVIVQSSDSNGIIDYRINDVAWKYLKSNRRFFTS